jgi:hypothetical protein
MKRILLIIPLILLLLQACVTSKSLSKKAAKMEQAGQYVAAADLYYQAVIKNSGNTDALLGMKRTGTRVLQTYLQDFSKAAAREDYKTAVYKYQEALSYQKQIRLVNVDLVIEPNYEQKYEDVLDEYIKREYNDGLKEMGIENFKAAEQHFNEVYKFDQNYRDVAELRNIAYLEPYYRKAEKLKDEQEWRRAYDIYNKILSRVGNYKDTRAHMNYVLKMGQITLAFASTKNSRYSLYAKNVKQFTMNEIMKAKDPFIKLVDRDDIDKVLKEQEIALSGMAKDDGQVEVGSISTASYVVIFDVTTYDVEEQPLRKTARKGFESYSEKYYDKEADKYRYRTKYKTVTYYEYQAYRKVSITTSYKIVSLSTGELLSTDIINKSYESRVHYVDYQGNKPNLYPSREGSVYTSGYRELQSLLKANRRLASKGDLTNEVYKITANTIARRVLSTFQK